MDSKEKLNRELAFKFKALGHPARLNLIENLVTKECCVGELQKCLSLSQPNVSQHLNVLKKAGIIEGTRKKTKICYRIADDLTKKALQIFLGEGLNESD